VKLNTYGDYSKYVMSLTLIGLFTGCTAITGHKDSMNQFDNQLKFNKCEFVEIDEKIKKDDDPILWGIQGGSLARNCLNYTKSNELFDKAEDKYKESVDKDNIANNALESTASVLVNNNVNNYEGNTYEKVMLNTYKALNFANLNDHQNARIEFNRALDRQRRAKEFFESEIKNKKEELEKKNKEEEKSPINTFEVASNEKTQDAIFSKYSSLLNDFDAYPDFVNPFTTYISGIYFLLNGDNSKSKDLLKESVSMNPKNKQILADFKFSDKNLLKKSKENYAWVIFENGQGMVKDEIRIDIPLFLFTSKVQYTGIALPKIVEKTSAYEYLDVNGQKTEVICNMDNVIKTEFKKKFPGIVTEAVMNTVVKTLAQTELNKKTGIVGGIAGALYQGMTNKADVRSWTALPKNFQSVRVKIDDNPIVIKNNMGNVIKSVMIPKGKNAMIYVKTQNLGNDKVHEILF
jgi:uncharacterized protein